MSDPNIVKHVIDIGAIFTGFASFMHWMPEVAALLSSIWLCIRIYEWATTKFKLNNKT